MLFSLTSNAYAAEIGYGQVFFGVKNDVFANPGETITIDLQFIGKAFEEETYDRNGTLVLPIFIFSSEYEYGSFKSFSLTDEAINAGITLNNDSEDYYFSESEVWGEIRMPASYLFDTDMTIAQLEVQISEDWPIVDYKAERDLSVIVAGEYDGGIPPYVENDNGDHWEIQNFNVGTGAISYQYQPTAKERLIEKLKEIARTIIDMLRVALTYVEKMLKPAAWNN